MVQLAILVPILVAQSSGAFDKANAALVDLGIVAQQLKGSPAGCGGFIVRLNDLNWQFGCQVMRDPENPTEPIKARDIFPIAAAYDDAEPAEGYPIGEEHTILSKTRTYSIRAVFDRVGLAISLSYDPRKTPPSGALDGYRVRMERLARWICSAQGFASAEPATNLTSNGAKFEGYHAYLSHTPMIKLTDWAARFSWTARTNEDAGTVYLTKGSHTILAPVGTNAMKVDGKWIRARGVTFYKNGTYYADVANLP